jgi:RNA polymerase-binding transcription factor DksA
LAAAKEQELKDLADSANMENINNKLDKLSNNNQSLLEKVNTLLDKKCT